MRCLMNTPAIKFLYKRIASKRMQTSFHEAASYQLMVSGGFGVISHTEITI